MLQHAHGRERRSDAWAGVCVRRLLGGSYTSGTRTGKCPVGGWGRGALRVRISAPKLAKNLSACAVQELGQSQRQSYSFPAKRP
eukprot:366404-Chlamydomonas_euryale.AAC.1